MGEASVGRNGVLQRGWKLKTHAAESLSDKLQLVVIAATTS
jgi:hypothetical protein